jgi:hypothetical protein
MYWGPLSRCSAKLTLSIVYVLRSKENHYWIPRLSLASSEHDIVCVIQLNASLGSGLLTINIVHPCLKNTEGR